MAVAGISLQELKDKFHLSQEQLDAEISDEHLKEASKIIADHEILGAELGLTQEEMTAISLEKTLELQRLAMLRRWKQKLAWKANYRTLIEAHLKCGRADRARDMCKLLTQCTYRHKTVYVHMHLPFQLSPVISGAFLQQPSASAGHSAALPTSPLSHHAATSTDGAQHGVFTSSQ